MLYEIETELDFDERLAQSPASLLWFTSSDCGVCKVLMPKMLEMQQTRFKQLQFLYIDISQFPALASRYSVFTVPSLLAIFDGKEFLRKARSMGVEEVALELERPYNMLFYS